MFDACICVDPDEMVTLLSRTQPRARKKHHCFECGHPIEAGQRYQQDATVYDGEFTVYKICIPCRDVRDSMFSCGFYYGGLWPDVHEAYCDSEICICPESYSAAEKAREK